MTLQETLAGFIVDDLGGETWPTGTVIDDWANVDAAKGGLAVFVEVQPPVRLDPNYDYYRCRVNLHCRTYVADDKAQAALHNIFEVAEEWARSLVPAAIGADGHVPNPPDGGGEAMDEAWQIRTQSTDVYVSWTGSGSMTTAA